MSETRKATNREPGKREGGGGRKRESEQIGVWKSTGYGGRARSWQKNRERGENEKNKLLTFSL